MRKLLVDANLLVLYVVGTSTGGRSVDHRRLGAYDTEDFQVLKQLIAQYLVVCTTSHALAEASNLLNVSTNRGTTRKHLNLLAQFISSGWVEIFDPFLSIVIAHPKAYEELGLTDAGLLVATETADSLVTADLLLFKHTNWHFPLKAINFYHLVR